jgi:N-acetylmuramic acid 6-phosphate etherase
MNTKAHQEAENFLNNEKQFHLGMLPTEQSNPKTRDLDLKFASDPSEGVKMLLSIDRDVQIMAQKILGGNEFQKMVFAGVEAISEGRKIVFSGCGATGRLSILLESIWRCFFRDLRHKYPEIYDKTKKFENSVFSIMTGGDYALIRSVEYFEDYQEFGRQQVREIDIIAGDVLIAITEGGETSSVLGSVEEAADRGAKVFLLFNNPADILSKHIERSRRAIEDLRVTVLDLYCGPMAIAGSTRMQATTSEQLIAGAALETILSRSLKQVLSLRQLKMLNIREMNYAEAFNTLLDELLTERNTEMLGEYIKMEKSIYQENGLVTYFANEFLLDIFTDTTERAPTFMLPPFKKYDDIVSKPSWAFVKYPVLPTTSTWEYVLGRPVRCLEWDSNLFRQMGTPDSLASSPPRLDKTQIVKFHIGNEEDASRLSCTHNIAVNVMSSREYASSTNNDYKEAFEKSTAKFQRKSSLIIGNGNEPVGYRISCSPTDSVLNLMEHMAIKLVFNTISTGTMVLMGRVTGNWMSWFEVTNKKLRDRGIRLISEMCGLSYRDACYALHETLEELKTVNFAGKEKLSPVQYTIKNINKDT